MLLPFKVGESPTLKIRGIIATQDIIKGQELERCPIILVEINQSQFLKKTVLWRYYFEWNAKYHCIALGYGSLINHSYTPNVRYGFNYKEKVLIFTALKNINLGEELFINYNYDINSQDPLEPFLNDFDPHRV